MSLPEWQEKDFNDFISKGGTGVVEFGAPWCAACKATEPNMVEVSQTQKGMDFAKIDVGKNPELASKMGVMSLPNVIIFSNGKVKEQMIGMTPVKTLQEKLAKIAK